MDVEVTTRISWNEALGAIQTMVDRGTSKEFAEYDAAILTTCAAAIRSLLAETPLDITSVKPPVDDPYPLAYIDINPNLIDRYLQPRCWKQLQDIAKMAGQIINVRRACPLKQTDPNDTHVAMDQDGGVMVDCEYPKRTDGTLDTEAMVAIVDAWVKVCCPLFGISYNDITNDAEIRVGNDVATLLHGFSGNRHLQVDDSMHHRFDDPIYPHWHGRFE